jgi:hypothetical protein
MDEWLDRGDKLASIGSFLLALIALLLGRSWTVTLLLFALGLAIAALIIFLRREREQVRERERFIAGKGFRAVRLDTMQPFTLTQLGHTDGAPFGQVWLGSVPFEILAESGGVRVLQVDPGPDNILKTLEIRVGIDQVKSVFFLINTSYGLKSAQGARPGEGWDEKVVGRLQFEFRDRSSQEQELRLGHHLRDYNVGNQPWAVDQLRNDQAREVWLAPDQGVALDLLRVDIAKPKFLHRIIVSAQLEVEQPRQVALDGQPISFPVIRIFGVTCWTTQSGDAQ